MKPSAEYIRLRTVQALQKQYEASLPKLTEAFDVLTSERQSEVSRLDDAFRDGVSAYDPSRMAPFIAWANQAVPGSFADLDRAVTRPSTKKHKAVPIVDGGSRESYRRVRWYHGSRAPHIVAVEGLCASPADGMVDTDPIGEVPWRLMETYGGYPPMSAVRRWQKRGYDLGYSWLGYWREALWQWYVSLSDAGRAAMATTLGWQGIPSAKKTGDAADMTADFLGRSLGLIWVSESIRTAREYARDSGAMFEVDLSRANIFGSWSDDLASGGEEVIVCPPSPAWCPQIPPRALKMMTANPSPPRPLGQPRDARITAAEAAKKHGRDEATLRAVEHDGVIYTALSYPTGALVRLHRRRDGKIGAFHCYPQQSWEKPHQFLEIFPTSG